MDSENELKFEFFKKFNYHFLPMTGPDITIEQATQLSKAGGSCGGPYFQVRQSPTDASLKFELEAKRIAFKSRADFTIVNQLPQDSPWWKRNKIYLGWMDSVTNRKIRKFKVKNKPALVVTLNGKHETYYDWKDLEKKISNFRVKAM